MRKECEAAIANRIFFASLLLATLGISAAKQASLSSQTTRPTPLDDRAIGAALCPIVYQVDRGIPSPRGYHYLFYGNGFFVDKDGYLLTDAHVLSQLHGGQPYLLLRKPGEQPYFAQADVVAIDRDHDVALLRAMPNPFENNRSLSFLPLAHTSPNPKETVVAAALRPLNPRDAYSLDPSLEERSPGAVLDFHFSRLGSGPAETGLFLFSHAIHPGQSGAPVISLDSHEVVGLVEGQWLHEGSARLAAPKERAAGGDGANASENEVTPIPGAAIPIHYALPLLQQNNVAWRSALDDTHESNEAAQEGDRFTLPVPLSLIAAPYPSQSLFGGEVMLDALVAHSGTVSGLRIVRGEDPFLETALDAVRTWTFSPARADGQPADARITIAFEFPQPYIPPRKPTVHQFAENSSAAARDRAAFARTTIEPECPSDGDSEGDVILYEKIDREGGIASLQVVDGAAGLRDAAVQAAQKWRFAPAMKHGAAVESAAIMVVVFRHPLATSDPIHP